VRYIRFLPIPKFYLRASEKIAIFNKFSQNPPKTAPLDRVLPAGYTGVIEHNLTAPTFIPWLVPTGIFIIKPGISDFYKYLGDQAHVYSHWEKVLGEYYGHGHTFNMAKTPIRSSLLEPALLGQVTPRNFIASRQLVKLLDEYFHNPSPAYVGPGLTGAPELSREVLWHFRPNRPQGQFGKPQSSLKPYDAPVFWPFSSFTRPQEQHVYWKLKYGPSAYFTYQLIDKDLNISGPLAQYVGNNIFTVADIFDVRNRSLHFVRNSISIADVAVPDSRREFNVDPEVVKKIMALPRSQIYQIVRGGEKTWKQYFGTETLPLSIALLAQLREADVLEAVARDLYYSQYKSKYDSRYTAERRLAYMLENYPELAQIHIPIMVPVYLTDTHPKDKVRDHHILLGHVPVIISLYELYTDVIRGSGYPRVMSNEYNDVYFVENVLSSYLEALANAKRNYAKRTWEYYGLDVHYGFDIFGNKVETWMDIMKDINNKRR
jgi:hypothetical protein